MKTISPLLVLLALASLGASPLRSEETTKPTCFYTGEAASPQWDLDYEGTVYHFSSEEKRQQFQREREASLYQRIGGGAALNAAVDLFYEKLLADERVNFHFEQVNMKGQIRKQKEFLAHALGAPTPWLGKDMRKAHAQLDLREEDFNIIASHLQAALVELKVDEALVKEIITLAASLKDDVLNR